MNRKQCEGGEYAGAFGAWSSSLYTSDTCVQGCVIEDNSLMADGTESERTMYKNGVMDEGGCDTLTNTQVQKRSCTNGTLSAYSPNDYRFSECQVSAPLPPAHSSWPRVASLAGWLFFHIEWVIMHMCSSPLSKCRLDP